MPEHVNAGRSAAWLARLPWEQEVMGSNPVAPTRAGLATSLGGLSILVWHRHASPFLEGRQWGSTKAPPRTKPPWQALKWSSTA